MGEEVQAVPVDPSIIEGAAVEDLEVPEVPSIWSALGSLAIGVAGLAYVGVGLSTLGGSGCTMDGFIQTCRSGGVTIQTNFLIMGVIGIIALGALARGLLSIRPALAKMRTDRELGIAPDQSVGIKVLKWFGIAIGVLIVIGMIGSLAGS